MATGNFYKKNAQNYYVLDFEETWQYEDHFEDMIEQYRPQGWYATDRGFDRETTDIMGKTFSIPSYKDKKAEPLEFSIHIVYNDGYYEAGCLDYRLCMYSDCEYNSIEDLAEDLLDEWLNDDWHRWSDVAKVQHKEECRRFITRHIEKAIRETERICIKSCHGIYGVSARFSNGETWYNKIK